jgi:hypothetical protein
VLGKLEIGRKAHLKSETRNLKLDSNGSVTGYSRHPE